MRNRERTRDGGARIQFICHRCVFTKCEIAHTRLTYQCLVAGGMDFRAMLMKRKVKQKKIVVKTIEWLEVNNLLFTIPPF